MAVVDREEYGEFLRGCFRDLEGRQIVDTVESGVRQDSNRAYSIMTYTYYGKLLCKATYICGVGDNQLPDITYETFEENKQQCRNIRSFPNSTSREPNSTPPTT